MWDLEIMTEQFSRKLQSHRHCHGYEVFCPVLYGDSISNLNTA